MGGGSIFSISYVLIINVIIQKTFIDCIYSVHILHLNYSTGLNFTLFIGVNM